MALNYEYLDSLPKAPVKCYEYTITKKDVINPRGEVVEDIIYYATPLEKGDLVILKDDSNSGGEIVVELFVPGNEANNIHGILVDSPQGADTVTADGGTPAHAQRRVATVAFFCKGITMLQSDGITNAGECGRLKEAAVSGVTAFTSTNAGAAANGELVCLAYTADTAEGPYAIGMDSYYPAD